MKKRVNYAQAIVLNQLKYPHYSLAVIDTETKEIFDAYSNMKLEPFLVNREMVERMVSSTSLVLPSMSDVVEWLREDYNIYVKVPVTNVKKGIITYDDLLSDKINKELINLLLSNNEAVEYENTHTPQNPEFEYNYTETQTTT